MKVIFPAAMAAALLASCENKEQEAEIAALKSEVREARRDVRKAEAKTVAALDLVKEMKVLVDEANERALRIGNSAERYIELAKDQAQLEAVIEEVPAPTPTPSRPMTDEEKLAAYEAGGITGVPPHEAREIIRKAKLEGNAWRANYEIEAEGKGFAAVHEFSTKVTQMPVAVRNEIVNHAKREHPGDWSRMADEVTEQAEAWTTLDGWKRTTVPGLDRIASAKVIESASTRYPGDWKMALFVVNDEVKRLAR